MPIRILLTPMLCMLLAALLCAPPALAQDVPPPAQQGQQQPQNAPTPLATTEPAKLALDEVERAVGRENATDATLVQARTSLEPVRDDLREAVVQFEQRLADVDAALKQIGAKPASDTQPEDAAIVSERERLTQRRGELDAALKQARLLTLRANDLAERITERRRSLFTSELLVRSSSALDPAFWVQVIGHVPEEARGIGLLLHSWWNFARDNGGYATLAMAALTLAALLAAGFAAARWLARRTFLPAAGNTRFAKSFRALAILVRIAVTAPAIVAAIVLILDGFGLVPQRIMEMGLGLIGATAIASIGRGVAVALFAPDEPQRRLLTMRDVTAQLSASHLTLAARVLGAIVFVNVLHRALVAHVTMTVATSILLAAAIALLLGNLLLRAGRGAESPDDVSGAPWLRGAGWILVVAIVVALVTGYVGLAAFLAGRFLVALAIIGALYIVLVVTDTLFTEVLTANTPRGRAVAAFFGIRPRSVELIGTLLSAVIRLLLILVVLFPLLGPWGIFAADFTSVIKDAVVGFRVGDVTISLSAIIGAVALLLAGILATRAAQRWLQIHFLPRTSLDPSLQISVSTIFGYACIIIVLVLTLAAIGIDLQKIALVAGALSIGIGFGLQSVVSNFVSGLILLAERPIRVGDVINVKGEEGLVRRIHVRATEIETFDRASVIVPNSELITGVVKNWTHADTMRRVQVKIGVSYDSDVEQVRTILIEIMSGHEKILKSPEPAVLLSDFGDSAILFEAFGVVRNQADAGTVKSEICFEILRRFREAGIGIPYPMREVILKDGAPPKPPKPSARGKKA